jgi:hypothetical protein
LDKVRRIRRWEGGRNGTRRKDKRIGERWDRKREEGYKDRRI